MYFFYFFFQGTVEPRIAKQRWAAPSSQKEIIDLEETVCLPRYQCGKNIRSSADFNTAYTDTLNDVLVSLKKNWVWIKEKFCFFKNNIDRPQLTLCNSIMGK